MEIRKTFAAQEKIFVLVQDTNKKWHIAVGQKIISQKTFNSVKEADAYINSKPYELLINLFCLIQEMQRKNEIETNSQGDKESMQENS